MRNPFKKAPAPPLETRSLNAALFAPGMYDGYPTDAGSYSERQSLGLSATWACVNLITNSISSLPLDTFRRDAEGKLVRVDNPTLVEQPCPEMPLMDWLTGVVMSLLLRGNSYNLVTLRDDEGLPLALMPIPDGQGTVYRSLDGQVRYRLGVREFQRQDVLHIRGLTPAGQLEGLSVISMARRTFGTAIATAEHAEGFFSNAAVPSVVIKVPDPADPILEKIREAWMARHGSARRRPAFMGTDMEVEPLTVSAEDAQLLESQEFNTAEVARLFLVPPHMIGHTTNQTSWGSGLAQQAAGFLKMTLRPWLTRVEVALSSLLAPGYFVKFNVDALLRGSTKERYESLKIAAEIGLLSLPEMRELEDLPPQESTGLPSPGGEPSGPPLRVVPPTVDPAVLRREG